MKRTLHPAYKQAIVDATMEFKYGDLIQWEWIWEKLDLQPLAQASSHQHKQHQLKLVQAVERFKQGMLEDHHMYLKSVWGEGYRIVYPEDQTEVVWKRLKRKIRNALRKAEDGLYHVNRGLMSNDKQRLNDEKLAKLGMLHVMNRKELGNNDPEEG